MYRFFLSFIAESPQWDHPPPNPSRILNTPAPHIVSNHTLLNSPPSQIPPAKNSHDCDKFALNPSIPIVPLHLHSVLLPSFPLHPKKM